MKHRQTEVTTYPRYQVNDQNVIHRKEQTFTIKYFKQKELTVICYITITFKRNTMNGV